MDPINHREMKRYLTETKLMYHGVDMDGIEVYHQYADTTTCTNAEIEVTRHATPIRV